MRIFQFVDDKEIKPQYDKPLEEMTAAKSQGLMSRYLKQWSATDVRKHDEE